MDGLKKRINQSIQTRLIIVMMATIVFVAILALFVTYKIAKTEAIELQDATLKQVMALASQGINRTQEYIQHNQESGLIITTIHPASNQVWQSVLQPSVQFGYEPHDGLKNIKINDIPYRAIIRTINPDQKLIVAQPTKLRDDAAISSAATSLTMLLFLAILACVLIYWVVKTSLRPLTDLSRQITQGQFDDLSALNEESLPIEVRPFVLEINRLFSRISQTIDIQRRFVADAAHELRTPLTALSLQVESLADATKSSQHKSQVKAIQLSVERCNHLVNQMLSLAKVQSSIEQPQESIDLRAAVIAVIEEFMPMVEAKHIDLGILIPAEIKLACHAADLKIVIRNVLSNAVKYTPPNGAIEISAVEDQQQVQIIIEDNGPGIAPTEMTQVFEPFYRGSNAEEAGVGLGLSIAKSAMSRIQGEIRLSRSILFNSGLRTNILIPKQIINNR